MMTTIRKTVPWLLASFLLVYHSVKIYHAVTTPNLFDTPLLVWITLLRLLIITSLLTWAFKPKLGLVMMWCFIGTLVATQLSTQWGGSLLNTMAPLKGLIFPGIITWLSKSKRTE